MSQGGGIIAEKKSEGKAHFMRILHTSDWHLGRSLYTRKRYDEFRLFLDWMILTLKETQADVLIAAGDIFDTTTPGTRAQELYYDFLTRASRICRHTLILAGNHDSPSFLQAPGQLLKQMNIHVVSGISEIPADDILVLDNKKGEPGLIIAAVPYLRDRDIRVSEAGESAEEKHQRLTEGIAARYAEAAQLALKKKQELGSDIPVIATGHLFAAGGSTQEGDGVRELYVGSLAHIPGSIFSDVFSYTALGHLHVPQTVAGSEFIRYSGSPLPMGFGEARQKKSLCLVEFSEGNKKKAGSSKPSVSLIDVPVFQRLEKISGDWAALELRLRELTSQNESVWTEIHFTGSEIIPDLRERLDRTVNGSQVEILAVRNRRVIEQALSQERPDEEPGDLSETEIFERLLERHETAEEQRRELRSAYAEIVKNIKENDQEEV